MQKIETTEKMYPFLVAECDGKVIGFTYGSQLSPHDAYQWDVETDICLAPDTPRCCCIGSAFYRKTLEMLKEQDFKSVFGVIAEANEPSLALHRFLGFYEAAYFEHRGYKRGMWHGIISRRTLTAFTMSLLPPLYLQNTGLEISPQFQRIVEFELRMIPIRCTYSFLKLNIVQHGTIIRDFVFWELPEKFFKYKKEDTRYLNLEGESFLMCNPSSNING